MSDIPRRAFLFGSLVVGAAILQAKTVQASPAEALADEVDAAIGADAEVERFRGRGFRGGFRGRGFRGGFRGRGFRRGFRGRGFRGRSFRRGFRSRGFRR
ncbi:MAG: hypothetical protein AAGE03_11110 [Pseudomonadota bacterium]